MVAMGMSKINTIIEILTGLFLIYHFKPRQQTTGLYPKALTPYVNITNARRAFGQAAGLSNFLSMSSMYTRHPAAPATISWLPSYPEARCCCHTWATEYNLDSPPGTDIL